MRSSPIVFLVLPLLLTACATARLAPVTRIEGESEFAAAVRAAVVQQEEGLRRCTPFIQLSRNYLEESMTSATVLVSEGSVAFEKHSAAKDLGQFEDCVVRNVLKDLAPPQVPPGRVAAVSFHFQGRDVKTPPSAATHSLVYNMSGAWLWLGVEDLDRTALRPAAPDFDPRKMQPPALLAQGGPRLSPELLTRVAGQTAISKCVITQEGRVERCRVIQSVPEADALLLQVLQGQRYRPVVEAGQPLAVDYSFRITFKAPAHAAATQP